MELPLERKVDRYCTIATQAKLETIMFSKPLSPFTKKKPDRSEETEDFSCFNLNYDFLERFSKKPLTLTSTRNRQQFIAKKMAEG